MSKPIERDRYTPWKYCDMDSKLKKIRKAEREEAMADWQELLAGRIVLDAQKEPESSSVVEEIFSQAQSKAKPIPKKSKV